MPELPELAIYAENLRPRVVGKAITAVKVHHSVALKKITADEFVRSVTEHIVRDVVRRGKTLGFSLDSDDRVDVHLMLKGNMYFTEPRVPEPCVALDFEDGGSLVFSDSQYSVSPPRAPRLWIGLNQEEDFGLDPSDSTFTAEILIDTCRKKKVPIKVLLTDQKVIGGLGNAYVDEILWVAKIKHDRIAALMTAEEVRKIHQAIGEILDLALRQTRKGLAGQVHGEVRDYFRVHLKTGKPCPQCGTKIAQEYFRGRITNWCPTCQI